MKNGDSSKHHQCLRINSYLSYIYNYTICLSNLRALECDNDIEGLFSLIRLKSFEIFLAHSKLIVWCANEDIFAYFCSMGLRYSLRYAFLAFYSLPWVSKTLLSLHRSFVS